MADSDEKDFKNYDIFNTESGIPDSQGQRQIASRDQQSTVLTSTGVFSDVDQKIYNIRKEAMSGFDTVLNKQLAEALHNVKQDLRRSLQEAIIFIDESDEAITSCNKESFKMEVHKLRIRTVEIRAKLDQYVREQIDLVSSRITRELNHQQIGKQSPKKKKFNSST